LKQFAAIAHILFFSFLFNKSELQLPRLSSGKVEEVRVMNHAVEKGGCNFGIGKNVVWAGEFKIGSDNH
jgi:hypothetical protein